MNNAKFRIPRQRFPLQTKKLSELIKQLIEPAANVVSVSGISGNSGITTSVWLNGSKNQTQVQALETIQGLINNSNIYLVKNSALSDLKLCKQNLLPEN